MLVLSLASSDVNVATVRSIPVFCKHVLGYVFCTCQYKNMLAGTLPIRTARPVLSACRPKSLALVNLGWLLCFDCLPL